MTIETKHTKELWRVIAIPGYEKMQGSFDTRTEARAYIEFWPDSVQSALHVTGPFHVGLDVKANPPGDWHTMEAYRRDKGLWADPNPAPAPLPPVFGFDPFAFTKQLGATLDELTTVPQGGDAVPQAVDLARGFGTVLASIADSLQRIAKAQETQIALAQIDIDQTIEIAADQIAQERAEQIMKEKTARSYIGRAEIT